MPGAPFMTLAADPCGGNDAYTKILLHMDGANAGTTFTDNNIGGSARTWTPTSPTTSTTQAKFGATSMSCGAATNFVTTPDSADFTLGSSDFTMDAWIFISGGAGTNRYVCGQCDSGQTVASRSVLFGVSTTNALIGRVTLASAETIAQGLDVVPTSQWVHVAFVRLGNVLRLYVNGVKDSVGDVAFTTAINDSANAFGIGCAGASSTLTFNGFIDEFRLSVGTSRWTANFAPPALRTSVRKDGHVNETVVMTDRVLIPWTKKINPLWWLVGPDGWNAPEFNNGAPYLHPLMNFVGFVIGVEDRNYSVTGPAPVLLTTGRDGVPQIVGWRWAILSVGRLRLPYVSYWSGRLEFYLGWRPASGGFGLKLVFPSGAL